MNTSHPSYDPMSIPIDIIIYVYPYPTLIHIIPCTTSMILSYINIHGNSHEPNALRQSRQRLRSSLSHSAARQLHRLQRCCHVHLGYLGRHLPGWSGRSWRSKNDDFYGILWEKHRKSIGRSYENGDFMGFYGIYHLVIKHGWLENGPFARVIDIYR